MYLNLYTCPGIICWNLFFHDLKIILFYQTDASYSEYDLFYDSIVTLAIIGILAWKHGRTWCNTICPVGTVLGLLSRFSLFKVRIDKNKCNGCGLCATKCKAACIDSKKHTIDYSRCVDCFDCLESCSKHALVYSPIVSKKKQDTDTAKRRFLMTGVMTAVAAPKILAQIKETTATLGGKRHIRKRIRSLLRDLSVLNTFRRIVLLVTFASVSVLRMYLNRR